MFLTTALLMQDVQILYYTYHPVHHVFEFLLREVPALRVLHGSAAKTGII